MFEYIVLVEFTAQLKENFDIEAKEVARYTWDLALETHDRIKLENISLFGEDPVSYTGTVKKKEKFIKQDKKNGIFGIYVWIEVEDKENFEKVRNYLNDHY